MPDKKSTEEEGNFDEGPASGAIISLSQALLAPLDAIFKAQIHAARSFLNMLLQLGYPHKPIDEEGEHVPEKKEGKTEAGPAGEKQPQKDLPYNLNFHYETMIDGKIQQRKVSIPALALVPVAPLAVESAEFKFGMAVTWIKRHRQIQESEMKTLETEKAKGYGRSKRPWFLVDDPISMRGLISPHGKKEETEETTQDSTIQIEVKVGKLPMPAGLDKLLTSLTQTSYITETDKEKNKPN